MKLGKRMDGSICAYLHSLRYDNNGLYDIVEVQIDDNLSSIIYKRTWEKTVFNNKLL